jgi:tetratricopeptide (TPR) repeat protein
VTGARTGLGPASLAVAAAIASACSASRSLVRAPAQPEVLVFDPVVITADGRDLAQLNDEELFALGSSAFAAGEYEKAARCFSRLADVYQGSGHRAAALYNAGLAYERLDRFQEALERFRPLADPDRGQGDSLGASFRAAECLYHLSRFDEAAAILAVIAARADVKPQERLEAKVHRGICLVEGGELEAGESALREALGYWTDKKDSERLDDYFPAQAQYYLGEVYRLHFERVALDPDAGEAKLHQDLEYKCDLLLSAQGHYLRAIRVGDGEWATASGFRIGALYEQLYDALIATKVPAGFDEEQAQVYREELRKRIRVLVSKAMDIYERTLEAAERVGAQNTYVQRARQSLERMKQILLEGGPGESAGSGDGKAAPLAGSPSEPPS